MAFKITSKITTPENFDTDKSLVFVSLAFTIDGVSASLQYFKTKADFKAKKNAFIPLQGVENRGAPTGILVKSDFLTNAVFWGNNLMMKIHNHLKPTLEEHYGVGNVEIIQDPGA